jgi:adhesin transport system outer membrane protein
MSWNLFSGGSDAARSDQYMEHLMAARSRRDKTCRDVRQAVDLAYHGVWTMTDQLDILEQRQKAIEKARYAYKKQFDLGQRSLLDLLDSENELYQAKRAYVNAVYDRAINVSKMLAGTGKLVNALGLTRLDAGDVGDGPVEGIERPEACPAEASTSMQDRKEELIQSALEQLNPVNASTTANTPVPTMTPLEPVGGQTPNGGLSPQQPTPIVVAPPHKAEAKPAAKPATKPKPTKKKHKNKHKHKPKPKAAKVKPPAASDAGAGVR